MPAIFYCYPVLFVLLVEKYLAFLSMQMKDSLKDKVYQTFSVSSFILGVQPPLAFEYLILKLACLSEFNLLPIAKEKQDGYFLLRLLCN